MEAQKAQVFANVEASAAISNFLKEWHDRHAHSRSAIQWNRGIKNIYNDTKGPKNVN